MDKIEQFVVPDIQQRPPQSDDSLGKREMALKHLRSDRVEGKRGVEEPATPQYGELPRGVQSGGTDGMSGTATEGSGGGGAVQGAESRNALAALHCEIPIDAPAENVLAFARIWYSFGVKNAYLKVLKGRKRLRVYLRRLFEHKSEWPKLERPLDLAQVELARQSGVPLRKDRNGETVMDMAGIASTMVFKRIATFRAEFECDILENGETSTPTKGREEEGTFGLKLKNES